MELWERRQNLLSDLAKKRLPGWRAFVVSNKVAADHLDHQDEGMLRAVDEGNEYRYEQFADTYRQGHNRINMRLAEAYRAENPDPETWELRYLKYMAIEYVKFSSPRGDFYVFPQHPRRKPKVPYWYTVDEMDGILGTGAAAVALAFDQLPMRSDSLDRDLPAVGEDHITLDLTGPESVIRGVLGKVKNERKGFR